MKKLKSVEEIFDNLVRDFSSVIPLTKSEIKARLIEWGDRIVDESVNSDKLQLPMGVSQWANHGKRHGYWNYFRSDIFKELFNQIEKIIPKYSKHNEWCECLEDENMPCDCGVVHHNNVIRVVKESFDKIKELYK